MTKKRNIAFPAVFLFLRDGNKILLTRRFKTDYFDGWYSVPAGHVDAGELPLDAIVREVKEEIGVTVEKKDITFVHCLYRTKHDETGDRVDIFFTATKWTGEITNAEPHKCDDVRWFPVRSLPKNVIPHVKDAIRDAENTVPFRELSLKQIKKSPKM